MPASAYMAKMDESDVSGGTTCVAENVAAARGHLSDHAFSCATHLSLSPRSEYLNIQTAQERQVPAEFALQFQEIHPGAASLHRTEHIHPNLQEVGQDWPKRTAAVIATGRPCSFPAATCGCSGARSLSSSVPGS